MHAKFQVCPCSQYQFAPGSGRKSGALDHCATGCHFTLPAIHPPGVPKEFPIDQSIFICTSHKEGKVWEVAGRAGVKSTKKVGGRIPVSNLHFHEGWALKSAFAIPPKRGDETSVTFPCFDL